MPTPSQQHFTWKPGKIHPLMVGQDYALDQMESAHKLLKAVGIGFNRDTFDQMYDEYCVSAKAVATMDNIQNPLTVASIPTPLQFLQFWMPGFVAMMTAARKADDLIGISMIGSWFDEQIVQQVLELSGSPVPYSDIGIVPLTDWNVNYVQTNVVRFEQGMKVGPLEEARTAAARIASAQQKRASCGLQLEIQRNAIAFFGYDGGNNLTYGFLTDPNLLPYVTVAIGATSGSKLWSLKTFQEIKNDLLQGFQTLRTQSQDTIDPKKTPITLAVATDCVDFLSQVTDFGISVLDWMNNAYPNVRVESAPQLNNANGGANVFYMYAETVADGLSTDDQRVFTQMVQAKFQLLGVAQLSKGYEEDYVNATAGTRCKRPYAVYRATGI